MPKISDKAIQMPASPIRKLVPYAETAKKAGLKIGSWTVNELSDLAILQAQGVEWITTNQPQQFQKQLKD